jgi:hypothetical protein
MITNVRTILTALSSYSFKSVYRTSQRVVRMPAWHLRDIWVKSRPGNGLQLLRTFMIVLISSMQIPGWYQAVEYESFVSRPAVIH